MEKTDPMKKPEKMGGMGRYLIWESWRRLAQKEKSLKLFLKQNFLFKDLSWTELDLVEKIVHNRSYRIGETIFRQGDVGQGMYIIRKGQINVYTEEIVPETGKINSILVAQLEEGDFFGDMALVEENGRRTASASANTDCILIGFFKPNLMEITEKKPTTGVKILLRLAEVLALRLKETTGKLKEGAPA